MIMYCRTAVKLPLVGLQLMFSTSPVDLLRHVLASPALFRLAQPFDAERRFLDVGADHDTLPGW